jgi:hypothetical protein
VVSSEEMGRTASAACHYPEGLCTCPQERKMDKEALFHPFCYLGSCVAFFTAFTSSLNFEAAL